VAVRPDAIRSARLEAGLTLKQVAGGALTKQALSMVERGKARPSLRTLRQIALRTGRSLDAFLAGPLPAGPIFPELEEEVAELERLAALQDYGHVLELGERLLQSLSPGQTRARVELCLGEACVRLFRPVQALEYLGPARAAFEEVGDSWQVVECMNWEANALYVQEAPGALELARQALEICRGLDPVPTGTELRIMTNLANMHAARHEWSEAVSICEQAMALADSVRDLGRMARMHYCLAVSYRNLGETSQALAHVQRALALHEFVRDDAQRARVQNTLGLILMKQGDLDAAERTIRSSLEGYEAAGQQSGRSHVLLSMAEVHSARGRTAEAEVVLREAVARFDVTDERMSIAIGHQLLGRALEAQGRHPEADEAFETALELLGHLQMRERLVECHAAYAAALEHRGEMERAMGHWKLGLLSQRPELVSTHAEAGELRTG
jgi:tetratricopeptide (TPR) repeat protein